MAGDIWLVRHALPLVAPGLCYGASDVPADAQATAQAAAQLAGLLPRGAQVWCSPALRCRQLAMALAAHWPDLPWLTDPRLVEMDFGHWEGVPWEAIPREALEAWTAQFWDHRFGGAESVAGVMRRVAAAWDECRQAAGPMVWITHAGVIRAASLQAKGVRTIARADEWPREALAFGCAKRLRADGLAPPAPGAPSPAPG